MRTWLSMLCAAIVTIIFAGSAAAQEVLTLETRPGVTQTVLVDRMPDKPEAIALLFPGSGGNIRIRTESGQIRFAPNNFLVRSRGEFVRHSIVAVVVDAPSDQSSGMDDNFRMSAQHTTDISAVINELRKRHADLPVFLVGTSRGTVSAAALGQRAPDGVAGVVLTATLFLAGKRAGQQGLSGFDFASIKPRMLFAHHKDDGCIYTPYRGASAQAARYPLVSVTGGDPAKSGPCEALSQHGFLGREAETVEAIANWMHGRQFRNEIN